MSVKGRGAILMEGVLNRAEANAHGKKIKKAFATSQDFHTGGATRSGVTYAATSHSPLGAGSWSIRPGPEAGGDPM